MLEKNSKEAGQQYDGAGTLEDPFVVVFREGDPSNPKSWPTLRKWGYMSIYSTGMMSGTFAVSSYTSGFAGMEKEFHTSTEVLALGQFTFLLGLAIGSLIMPAMGDLISRKWMGTVTLTVFALFSVGTAAAHNMATVIVSRFLSGVFGAGIQALGPSSLASLFLPHEIATPFCFAAVSPLLGPAVGPLVGGYVTMYTGNWRNINWVAVGFAAFEAVLSLFVPEIHAPHLLRKRATALSAETGKIYISTHDLGRPKKDLSQEVSVYLKRPVMYLLKEPIAFLFSSYIGFLFAILQLYFTAFPIVYQTERHYSQGKAGLPFIALIVGYYIAVPATMLCSRPFVRILRRDGYAAPEHRLYLAMICAVALPISLFWMAWTAKPSVHWINPVIAGGIFGFGQIGITMAVLTFFADLYTVNAGAVYAGMNMMRYGVSAVFPLFARQLFARLGVPWGYSLLGFLLLGFMPVPFVFYVYGPAIRKRSKLVTAKNDPPPKKVDLESAATGTATRASSATADEGVTKEHAGEVKEGMVPNAITNDKVDLQT